MPHTGFEAHDHAHCIDTALASVEQACASRGLQLTASRRRVLEILLQEHRALGAYDILAHLSAEGHPAQPPVAYRALDFLVGHGFAHKIERLSAYVACTHPNLTHRPVFLICRVCDAVAEAPGERMTEALRDTARDLGFGLEGSVIEALGICPACQEAA